jgi:hypothetical protein
VTEPTHANHTNAASLNQSTSSMSFRITAATDTAAVEFSAPSPHRADHRREPSVEGRVHSRSSAESGAGDHITQGPHMGRVYSVASNGTWVSITPASTLIESGSGSSRGGSLWLVPARSGHWLIWWACERVIEGLTTNAFQSTCP